MTEDSILCGLRRYSRFIGDDCAVLPPVSSKYEMLFTADFTIEGVHFSRSQPAESVGHKALARSLSDIAAMGGKPLYCMISLALAPWTKQPWINGFYRGLLRLLKPLKASIAGGDISHAGQLVCDVMICGAVPKGRALRRDGARPGDVLYVSAPLGGWKHKPVIEPRLAIGRKLVGKASACMDISDGLALDLHRLCRFSGVAADLDSIPLLAGATIEQALHDGEDYELLYTASPQVRVPGIRIGAVASGKPGSLRYRGRPIKPQGYDHTQQHS